jgi:hypothetical protein
MQKKSRLGRLTTLVLEGRLALPVLLGLLSLGFSVVGWLSYLAEAPEMSWPLKLATTLGRTLGAFVPDGAHFERANTTAKVGATLGMLATTCTGALLALALLRQEIARFRFRFLASGHHIVVGDSVFASRMAAALQSAGHKVIQALPEGKGQRFTDRSMQLPLPLTPKTVERALRARRATQVIVDLGADEETLSFARRFGRLLSSVPAPPRLLVSVSETTLTRYFADLASHSSAALRPDLFCQNTLVARQMLATYPLFLQAATQAQPRVHALIIGFGNLGEAIFDQIMLTSLAGDLLPPKVTILDVHGDVLARSFAARRPHVLQSLDVTILDFNAEADIIESDGPLMQLINTPAPITAVFVALASDAQSIRVALMVHGFQARTGKLKAPIFYRCNNDSADALHDDAHETPWPWASTDNAPLIRLGLSDTALVRAVLPGSARELMAQRLHAAYRATADAAQPAAQPWATLADTYRRANVRAADHLAAKVWTLGLPGVTIDGLDPGAPPQVPEAARMRIAALAPGDAALRRLAALEHGRWVIDRKLDGWRYGAVRDNMQRLHPMLIDWDSLRHDAVEVAKDEAVVLESLRAVIGAQDGRR